MSTVAKTSARKDKIDIGGVFKEREAKKAVLAQADLVTTPQEDLQKPDKINVKPEEPVSTKKKTSTGSKKNNDLFAQTNKKKYQQKSVYLSTKNVSFIKKQSEEYGIAFSEVLNRIVDNFIENQD